jgi:hypothetical protein
MWRIIKSELEYIKPGIIAVYAFCIFNMLLQWYAIYLQQKNEDIGAMWQGVIITIPSIIFLSSLVLTFILLILEVKENRIRQFAILPLSLRSLSLFRILLPMALIVIFMLLASLDNVVENFIYLPYISQDNPQVQFSIFSLLFAGWMPLFPWLFVFTYGIWLEVEHHGRILLIAFIICLIVYNGFFAPMTPDSSDLGQGISKLQNWFDHHFWLINVLAIMFAGVIYGSFIKRKSFMQ